MADRSKFLGASDAAAALGLSRWKTPLELWAEKTGQVKPPDISDKLYIKLGNRMEEVVAELFVEQTGKKIKAANQRYTHPKYPFLSCETDRDLEDEDAILQCKTANAWKKKEWGGEDIPLEYIIQEHHELAVTGKKRAYIAVLIGNEEFKFKVIERDEKVIADLVEKEVAFWNNFVVPCIMPMTIMAQDTDILYQLFPLANEAQSVDLDENADLLCEGIDAATLGKDNLEESIVKMKNELRALLKDASAGRSKKYQITWKNRPTSRCDTKQLKVIHPDIYEKFIVKGDSRVLLHKLLKQEKAI